MKLWLRKLLGEILGQVLENTLIYYDNKTGIRLEENYVFHDKSKHIDIQYHFICDMVQRGAIRLQHIVTDNKDEYILTQALSKGKFLVFIVHLGLKDVAPLDKGQC